MKDAHITELYTAYLDGSLPEHLRQQADAHLHACPQCAAGLDELRRLVDELSALPAPALPADFAAGVRARLTPRPQRRVWNWRIPVFAGGAVAAAVALVLVLSQMTPAPVSIATNPAPPAVEMQPPADTTPAAKSNKPHSAAGKQPVQDPFAVGRGAGIIVSPSPKTMPTGPAAGVMSGRAAKSPQVAGEKKPLSRTAPIVVAMAPPDNAVKTMRMGESGVGKSVAGVPESQGSNGKPGPAISEGSAGPPGVAVSPPADAVPGDSDTVDIFGREGAMPSSDTGTAVAPDAGSTITAMKDDDRGSMFSEMAMLPAGTNSSKLQVNGAAAITLDQATKLMRRDELEIVYGNAAAGWKDKTFTLYQRTDGNDAGMIDFTREALLHVNAPAKTRLTFSYTAGKNSKPQNVVLPGNPADVLLLLPALTDGAALKLSLTGQGKGLLGEAFYLVLPGNGTPQEKSTVQVTKQPRLQVLLYLANAGGLSILCPTVFGDAQVTFTAANISPLDALSQLARQAKYRIEANGALINVLPVRK